MDINDATRQELEEVGQIDGERARYLVEHREKNGSFRSWEDVKDVPSYEDGMIERLQRAGFSIGAERGRASSEERREARSERSEHKRAETHQGRESRGADRSGAESRDLNRASAGDLERTHMIDGERARRLVEYRERHGGFSGWDDVKNVSGFDAALVERLKGSGFRLK